MRGSLLFLSCLSALLALGTHSRAGFDRQTADVLTNVEIPRQVAALRKPIDTGLDKNWSSMLGSSHRPKGPALTCSFTPPSMRIDQQPMED